MVKSKFSTIGSVSCAVAVLFIIIQVALTAEPISYDAFLQCLEDAVTSDNTDGSSNLKVSELPDDILNLIKEELYENKVLKDFATTSKEELTEILTNDVQLRRKYFETNKKIFQTFLTKVLRQDVANYPDENSGLDPNEIYFLSLMTREAVDKFMDSTIIDKQPPSVENWKVLTLKDAFRTVFFYCKYPKEMAAFLTEEMRVEVKEWLDSTATWGKWGFESDDSEPAIKLDNVNAPLKLEL